MDGWIFFFMKRQTMTTKSNKTNNMSDKDMIKTQQQEQQQQQQQQCHIEDAAKEALLQFNNNNGNNKNSPGRLKKYGSTTKTNATTSSERSYPSRIPDSPLLRRLSASMHPHHHSLLGIILIMMGSFSFSCMFLFVKFMQGRANTFVLGFYRALVEIPIALYLCWSDNEHPLGPPEARAWLWVRGGMGAAAVLCFFYAIQHLPLPDAVTLQFTTPPFAAAFAVCLAGEKWQTLDMLGAVVCLMGVVLIAHPSWLFGAASTAEAQDAALTLNIHNGQETEERESVAAIAVALLGAAFAGLAYTSVRKIGHGASANVMVLYYSMLSLPVVFVSSRVLLKDWNVWGGGGSFTFGDWFWVLLTGVTAYSGQYLTNLGLQHESAATGTLATCSQIVFTYLFELVFLHEPINIWSVAGTLLILGFMMIVGSCKMNQADETMHEMVAGEPESLALLFSAERDVLVTTDGTRISLR